MCDAHTHTHTHALGNVVILHPETDSKEKGGSNRRRHPNVPQLRAVTTHPGWLVAHALGNVVILHLRQTPRRKVGPTAADTPMSHN